MEGLGSGGGGGRVEGVTCCRVHSLLFRLCSESQSVSTDMVTVVSVSVRWMSLKGIMLSLESIEPPNRAIVQ